MDGITACSVCDISHATESLMAGVCPDCRRHTPIITPTTALDTQVGGGHYKELAIQPVEFCQKNKIPYCESNVIKYVTRHRFKNGREDIKKAIHYLELLLQMEYSDDE